MSDHDQLIQTIEAIYASGVETDRLPVALELTSRLLGTAGAAFEVIDLTKVRHTDYWAIGTPGAT